MFPRPVSSAAPSLPDVLAPPTADPARGGATQTLVGQLQSTLGIAPMSPIAAPSEPDPRTFAGLAACIDDARAAALVPLNGPPDPTTFATLRTRLVKAAATLPPAYREAVAEPLLRALDELGARGFARLLAEDPDREGEARLLLDVAQAVLQRGEAYQARATAAFQEVVSDLYDGFLSAEDRRGVKPPDVGVVAPLVVWGSADAGPYTWPADATASLDVKGAVVSLPAANADGGLLAWPALAHETAGHDILSADDGLRDELAEVVRGRLLDEKMTPAVADYWAERIDETAADVLGVLNMGPAAAVGLVGYFRALNGAWAGRPALRNVGAADDPHPADIVRAYVAAETVRLLSFKGAESWADRLVAEVDRDLGRIRLGEVSVTAAVAKASAAAVARAIVRTRLDALDGRAFGDIQDWRDRDEAIVGRLRSELAEGSAAGRYAEGAYAAHAVAAGVYDALSGRSSPAEAMRGMIGVLAEMHARNPSWEPRASPPAPPPGVAAALRSA